MSTAPSGSPPDALADAVLEGLAGTPKTTPAALLYDEVGTALFESICEQPEYYPTRTELGILERVADQLAAHIGPRALIIEPGSGAAVKVRHVLRAMESPAGYMPIDVASEQLYRVARERAQEFPGVRVVPIEGDFSTLPALPQLTAAKRRVAFFPGSTIGNLHPAEAASFLRQLRDAVGATGGLVLGVDRRKAPHLLHAAYNDAAGVTAAFNENVLTRLNREYRATFRREAFRHHAWYNEAESRIEMHLVAATPQQVQIGPLHVTFATGESIRTEVSYKYDRGRLEALAGASGWRVVEYFTDDDNWFWVVWLVPTSSPEDT